MFWTWLLAFLAYLNVSGCSTCTSPVYCNGPLLTAVQLSGIFNDSKTFVDMPMIYPQAIILEKFAQLPGSGLNATKAQLNAFLIENFLPAGSDLVEFLPNDYTPIPSFLKYINDSALRQFAQVVHTKWHVLVRTWNRSLEESCTGCTSHIDVPNPFVIAGSRFREFYYWDTFWTLEGLLVSGMLNTSRGIIENFLHLVDKIGFVPNGGRIYYLNRSQPPMLCQMVRRYYEETGDMELLSMALPLLDKEYQFWMDNSTVHIDNVMLNRYYVVNSLPRPESYAVDVALSLDLPNPDARASLFQELATGAETGWDFSSRWMREVPSLASLQTTDIVPVDLNSILYYNEITLAEFHKLVGGPSSGNMSDFYIQQAQSRKDSISTLLWNQNASCWNDYRLSNDSQDASFYPSNLVPLWAGDLFLDMSPDVIDSIISKMDEILDYPSGVPTSLYKTGQQWDFPNGWAPLQYFIIEGLENVAQVESLNPVLRGRCAALALRLATRWITTNYCAWNATGLMFEKYDVTVIGNPGGGGEYDVQDGFGWTNGVALHLLKRYGGVMSAGTCQ